ncbi:MAG: TonB-dependent receptor [Azoarcus sp.]|nr:TonB-dependent receptor [Azoarcus sp.]
MPTRKYLLAALSLPATALLFPLPSFAQVSSESTPPAPTAANTLDVVVVTANRTQETKSEISSNVTIIDSEDIKASTATSVADLVTQHGFHVVTMGDNSNVQIRGMGNLAMANELENQVLILLNGRRIGMSNLALMGLSNVDRVEIIRGPSAVQYGSSAMGGVINIITKRGDAAKPFVSLELGIGSDSLKREKVAFGGAVNGFDFSFGGTHYSRNDMTTEGGRRWYHTAVDKNLTYNLDLGYSFNKNHRVGINLFQGEIKSELMTNSISFDGIRPYDGNSASSPYTDHFKRNTNTAFSYTGSTDSKNIDWMVNYSFGSNDQKQTDSATGIDSFKSIIDNKAINAHLNYRASLFSLSGGVDRYQYDISGFSGDPKSTMKDTGVYMAGKLHFLEDRLVFSLGLRHDKYENSGTAMDSQDDTHTGGSIGVSYLPLSWLKLRANYSSGFKMPSPQQVGGDGPYYYVANPALKPEQNKTWEFGADIDWRNVNASLTYFHSDWKDKIIGLDAPPGSVCASPWMCYQSQNLEEAEVAGIEGSASWDIGKAFKQNYSLTPYVSFTWLTTRKNKDPSQFIAYHGAGNQTMPNTPKWMASYGIDYAHSGLKVKSRLNANYYGKTLTRDWSGTIFMPPGDDYFVRPGGTVVNWSLEKELVDIGRQYGKLTLRTEVNNLFDKANEMYWNYPGPGRNFYVGLRYDF